MKTQSKKKRFYFIPEYPQKSVCDLTIQELLHWYGVFRKELARLRVSDDGIDKLQTMYSERGVKRLPQFIRRHRGLQSEGRYLQSVFEEEVKRRDLTMWT